VEFLNNIWTYLVNWWNGLFHQLPVTNKITLFDIVVAYNSPYVAMYPLDTGKTINAQIFKNDTATSQKVADLITSEATRVGLPILYLAACIMQESRFSPTTFNHNLCAENLTPNFAKTDWGLCQMSGTYLPSKPGMAGLTDDQMAAKACTPEWAVPQMADIMAENIVLANKYLLADHTLSTMTKTLNNTTLTDAQFLATLAYNRGWGSDDPNEQAGARYYVKHSINDMIKHPYRVGTWFAKFTNDMTKNTISD